jgi:hypothetical protein
MTRVVALLLLGLIMPELCRLVWRLDMSVEMPDTYMPIWPIPVEWSA